MILDLLSDSNKPSQLVYLLGCLAPFSAHLNRIVIVADVSLGHFAIFYDLYALLVHILAHPFDGLFICTL